MPVPESDAPFAVSTSATRVLHRAVTIDRGFGPFTRALERLLGHFPSDVEEDFTDRPDLARERIRAAEGAEELMIFAVIDHGAALNMAGTRGSAKQYLVGNPLTALDMSVHDIRAALYAPLRMLVYLATDGRTVVEYDQPSTQLAQFGREEVTRTAQALEARIERVLALAGDWSRDLKEDSLAVGQHS